MLGLVLLFLPVLAYAQAQASEESGNSLTAEIQKACQALAPVRPAAAPGRIEDLEIYLTALVLDDLDAGAEANNYRQYLLDYFDKSPLLRLVSPLPADTGYLNEYNPSPAFSRLVKIVYADMLSHGPQDRLDELADMLELQIKDEFSGGPGRGCKEFLETYPDSPYAGWCAYQLVWVQALRVNNSKPLELFSQQYPRHRLGQEAQEAAEMRFFSPRHMAQLSTLLPGLGEETLDPGMRESSTFMYSEILYALGTAGFIVAAQYNSRAQNLTGALILGNLLMMNHRSSGENAYALAQRRNQSEARKFMQDRIDNPVAGEGSFVIPHYAVPETLPMDDELLLSLHLPWADMAQNFRGQNLVHDDQLYNIGLRAEYVRSLFDIARSPDWAIGVAAAPYGRFFSNVAGRMDDSELTSDLYWREWLVGAEAALMVRWIFEGPWLQLRLSAGPAWRDRYLASGSQAFQAQEGVASATAAFDLGGLSGTYWHLAVTGDNSFRNGRMVIADRLITLPGLGLAADFGLGVRF
jgi:hypothetical protein